MKKNFKKRIKHYFLIFIPALLLAIGALFFVMLTKTGGQSGVLTSFSNLLWWTSGLLAFLGLITIVNDLLSFFSAYSNNKKNAPIKEKKTTRFTPYLDKIKSFFDRFKKKSVENESSDDAQKEEPATPSELSEIPLELKKIKERAVTENTKVTAKASGGKARTILSVLYVAALAIGLYFFCSKMLASAPLQTSDTYSFGLLTTLYFLFFSVILSIWNMMRWTAEEKGTYRISGDILKLISAVSVVYAGVIAVQSVLAINALAVIPWVIRAVVVYLTVAVAINIIIAIMKGDIIGDVDYPMIPSRSKEREGVLDSDDVRARFSLKSLWSIKFALRLLPGIALSIGAVLLISTMFFVVQPGEQAALYRFGTLSEDGILDSGLHVKLPWPIDKVDKYNVDSVTTVRIGYDNPTGTDYLWTMSHGGEEYPLLTGNGTELVAVNIKLAYRIGDLYSYVNTATYPESVISAAAYESIMRRTINTTLDSFLSVDRASLSEDLKAELQAFSDERALGIEVVDIIIENIHPPVDIADVYQAVITASVDKQTLITEAEASALEEVNYAKYYKEQLINDALKNQAQAVGAATGEMAYYYAAMEAYKVNPECFRLTQYISVQAKRIAGTKVYYFSPKAEAYINNFIIGGNTGTVVATDNK